MSAPRPSFSAARRAAIFRDAGGVCHLCTRKIAQGEPWEVERDKATIDDIHKETTIFLRELTERVAALRDRYAMKDAA